MMKRLLSIVLVLMLCIIGVGAVSALAEDGADANFSPMSDVYDAGDKGIDEKRVEVVSNAVPKGGAGPLFPNTMVGARVWTCKKLDMLKSDKDNSKVLTTIGAGKRCVITKDYVSNKRICVKYGSYEGWVNTKAVMINLPDVMPEPYVFYNITNATGAIYKSSGKDLKNVTGKKLYTGSKNNGKNIAPLMFKTAVKLEKVRKAALKDGNYLKVYDSYRPWSVTEKLNSGLNAIMGNSTVKNGINSNGYNKAWFLAQSKSSHNCGAALDITLCDKNGKDCTMPTAMHELSAKARWQGCSAYKEWRDKGHKAKYETKDKNSKIKDKDPATKLHNYFVKNGFVYLGSEWWHFQDNDNMGPKMNFQVGL